MKRIVILIIISTEILTICNEGCLRCSRDNRCLLCNQYNNYIVKNDQCEKNEISFCNFQTNSGKCLSCSEPYVLEKTTNKCVKIEENEIINFCHAYKERGVCSECVEGFYLKNGKCEQIVNAINYCRVYYSEDRCFQCENGYVLNVNNNICEKIEDKDNCVAFNNIECLECDTGYFLNDYKHLEIFTNDRIGEEFDWDFFHKSQFAFEIIRKNSDVCSKIVLDNCLDYQSSDKCKKCREDYFLDENQNCVKNPPPVIDNCFDYKNFSECKSCKINYYLKNSKKCEFISIIENCLEYCTTCATTTCLECQKEYYLDNNKCVKRLKKISNCAIYKINSEDCEFCEEGKIIYNWECVDGVKNCLSYYTSSNSCQQCNKKYYLRGKECLMGNIENCSVYFPFDKNVNEEKCQICKENYFLYKNQCYPHNEISGCVLYDAFRKNLCQICKTNAILINHKNYCLKVDVSIPKCKTYSNSKTCIECEQDHYLHMNQCLNISNSLNCETLLPTQECIKCKKGFVLSYNKCFEPSELIADNCAEINTEGGVFFHQGKCEKCEENSFSYNMDGVYYCLENIRKNNVVSSLISKCVNYSMDGNNVVKCKKCEKGYLIKNNECVEISTCNDSIILYEVDLSYKLLTMPKCENLIEGCEIIIPNNKNPLSYECAKCRTNYSQKIKDLNEDFTNYNFLNKVENLEENVIINNPVTFYPRIQCENKSDTDLYVNNNVVDNCEYFFWLNSLNKLGCLRCSMGYKGEIEKYQNNYFIKNCIRMLDCDISKTEKGLSKTLNQFFSCNFCTDVNKIPVLFFGSGQEYEDLKNLITYDNNMLSAESGGFTIECKSIEKSDYYITSDFSIPDNCSHLAYNIESLKNASHSNSVENIDRRNIAVFCMSCKPGARAVKGFDTENVEIKHFVGNCEIIENCLSSNWLNFCSACKSGYVWGYNQEKGLDFSQCLAYNGVNCKAVEKTSSNQINCVLCQKGFFLNNDKICVRINIKKCSTFAPWANLEKNDFSMVLFSFFDLVGCQNCQYNEILFSEETTENNICVFSEYLSSLPNNTNYIKNCLISYNNTFPFKCSQCKPGFLKDENEFECISSSVKNCLQIRKSSLECVLCEKEFVLVKGICEIPNISNCDEYYRGNSDIQKCINCQKSFFLKDGLCVKGSVLFCEIFEKNKDICKKCTDGYFLIKNAIGEYFCLPLIFSENCVKIKIDENIKLDCLECAKDTFLTEISSDQEENDPLLQKTLIKSSCIELATILNCLLYDISENVYKSSFECKQCKHQYYLSEKRCEKHKDYKYCLEYHNYEPICEKCFVGYYWDENKNDCVENPKGIQNCKNYFSFSECHLCEDGFYLAKNACLEVSQKNENCISYFNENSCMECRIGYFLRNGECVLSSINHCVKFYNENNCMICEDGFVLTIEENKFICRSGDSDDQNCEETDYVNKKCKRCREEYFYDEDKKVCVKTTKMIENCSYYEAETKCRICDDKFVLAQDKSKCYQFFDFKDILDPFCKKAIFLDQNKCEVCKQGYYKNKENRKCIECDDYMCAFCNPFRSSECLMCKENSYQNSRGECVLENFSIYHVNYEIKIMNLFLIVSLFWNFF